MFSLTSDFRAPNTLREMRENMYCAKISTFRYMEQHSRLCDVEKEQVRVRNSANPPTNGMILSYMFQVT